MYSFIHLDEILACVFVEGWGKMQCSFTLVLSVGSSQDMTIKSVKQGSSQKDAVLVNTENEISPSYIFLQVNNLYLLVAEVNLIPLKVTECRYTRTGIRHCV